MMWLDFSWGWNMGAHTLLWAIWLIGLLAIVAVICLTARSEDPQGDSAPLGHRRAHL
jgi:hypothetical protein